MAGRSLGRGLSRWPEPSSHQSRRRGRHRHLFALWRGPLSPREGVRSGVGYWRSLSLLGWARASCFLLPPAALPLGAPAQRAPPRLFAGPPLKASRIEASVKTSRVRAPVSPPPATIG